MAIFLQLIVSGLSIGMIYALIAFGFGLTYATSRTLNFGQGEAVMLGALVGLSCMTFFLNYEIPPLLAYLLMLPPIMLFGALQGTFVERLGVRQALQHHSEAGWIMSTLALGMIFKNLAENIWGRDALRFPSPLPEGPWTIGTHVLPIDPMQILIIFGALLFMLCIEIFNRTSFYGKAVVATANDTITASLMGINTKKVIIFSYALSSLSAAIAGVLVAPVTLTGGNMGSALVLKAFAVAIIGGLTSGIGALVGGALLGLTESMTSFYLSTGYKDVPGLILLLIILALKPSGLFGKPTIKKV